VTNNQSMIRLGLSFGPPQKAIFPAFVRDSPSNAAFQAPRGIDGVDLLSYLTGAAKEGPRKDRRTQPTGVWSGRRESNPRMQLGKLPFYH
jgi:hypothetical protein